MQAKSPMPTLAIDVGNDVGPKKPRYTSIGRARNPPANCVVNMQTHLFDNIPDAAKMVLFRHVAGRY